VPLTRLRASFASVYAWVCSPICAPLPYALALVGGIGAVYLSGLAQAVWIVATGVWSVALYASEHPRFAATPRARTALAAAAFSAWGLAFALGVGAAEIREVGYAREKTAFARLLSEGPRLPLPSRRRTLPETRGNCAEKPSSLAIP